MITTRSWKGTFQRKDDKTWARVNGEEAVNDGCGGVELDRLELDEGGYFYNLIRRSVSSNPNGTFVTGESCSKIYSGEEITYTWREQDIPAKCDYIKFNLYD